MSQYPGNFNQPYAEAYAEPPKTSGLAIAALVCSLIFCCPVTTILGIILGAIAMVTIGSAPGRKGRGLAITAILLGLIFTIGQAYFSYQIYDKYARIVMEGPRRALERGYAGDLPGFKSHFHGRGATASDAEAQQFIDELRTRYGNFVSVTMDHQAQPVQPKPGQPEVPFPYVLTFQNKPGVNATVIIIMSDQKSILFDPKLISITVHDANLGDLEYPPGAGTGATTAPSSPATTSPAAGSGS
jgi:hypothetical protein